MHVENNKSTPKSGYNTNTNTNPNNPDRINAQMSVSNSYGNMRIRNLNTSNVFTTLFKMRRYYNNRSR